jgi:alpha/beta superfamily hydrolase
MQYAIETSTYRLRAPLATCVATALLPGGGTWALVVGTGGDAAQVRDTGLLLGRKVTHLLNCVAHTAPFCYMNSRGSILYANLITDDTEQLGGSVPESQRPDWAPLRALLTASLAPSATDVTFFIHCAWGMNRSVSSICIALRLAFPHIFLTWDAAEAHVGAIHPIGVLPDYRRWAQDYLKTTPPLEAPLTGAPVFAFAPPGSGGGGGGGGAGATPPAPAPPAAAAAAVPFQLAAGEAPFDVARASGYLLRGVFLPAAGGGVGRGVVLLLHGMVADANHSFAPQLARALSASGFSSLRFNFRGVAPSAEEPSHRYRICGVGDDVEDLALVHAAAGAALGRVVALVGHSRGANAALLHAGSCGAALPAVVAIAPRFHWEGMLTSGKIIAAADVAVLEAGAAPSVRWATRCGAVAITREDVATLRAWGTAAEALGAIPCSTKLLFVHGTKDVNIPAADSRAAQATRPDAALELVEGAAHNFKGHEERLCTAVTGFLARTCQGGGGVSVV